MAWWPWNKRSSISYEEVEPLTDDEVSEARLLVHWALENFEPRSRPVQRWKVLTRWDTHGAEDALAALDHIEELSHACATVSAERQSARQRAMQLQRLTGATDYDAVPDQVAQEVEESIEEHRAEQARVRDQLRSARDLLEEVLGPLRRRHHELHGQMDELTAQEEALSASVAELESQLGSTVEEIGRLERGLRELEGTIRGLR